MLSFSKQLALLLVIWVTHPVAYSDTFRNTNNLNVAIDGYDSVAYFTERSAVMGQSDHQVFHAGAIWYFSTEKNKKIFEQNPSNFIPRFAGHCANGLSDGHLVLADPTLFRVIDGDLYFFFSHWGRAQWGWSQAAQIALAEQHWAEFKTTLK